MTNLHNLEAKLLLEDQRKMVSYHFHPFIPGLVNPGHQGKNTIY